MSQRDNLRELSRDAQSLGMYDLTNAACQGHLDSASRQEHPDAMPTTPQVQEGLDAIAKAAEDVNASERALRWLVAVTKHQGATWQQIGDVLGVSRQSAQERFGKDVES